MKLGVINHSDSQAPTSGSVTQGLQKRMYISSTLALKECAGFKGDTATPGRLIFQATLIFVPRLNKVEEGGYLNYPSSVRPGIPVLVSAIIRLTRCSLMGRVAIAKTTK